MAADLRRLYRARAPYQTFSYAVGAVLCLAAAVHILVFAVDGGPWAGPVGWRKPITFGLSLGATTLTFGWLASYLRLSARAGWWLLGSLGAASLVEYTLITLQAWRRVPSHFNDVGPLDGVVWVAMASGIAVIALSNLAFTVLALGRRMRASDSLALAIRVGLVLLMVGNLMGGFIVANGYEVFGPRGGAPHSVFRTAGEIKVPHAVALHAVQVLPVIGWLLAFTPWRESRRRRVVLLAAAGYSGLVGVTLLQVVSGRAQSDLLAVTGLLLLASLLALGLVIITVGRGLGQPSLVARVKGAGGLPPAAP